MLFMQKMMGGNNINNNDKMMSDRKKMDVDDDYIYFPSNPKPFSMMFRVVCHIREVTQHHP
jgi:hypothetical protein